MSKLIDLLKQTTAEMRIMLADYQAIIHKAEIIADNGRDIVALLSKHLNDSSGVVLSLDKLSKREIEIFEALGEEMTVRQIADKFKLSVKTINSNRDRIRKKLGVDNGYELKRLAITFYKKNK